jgi:glycosyltransferase involved in cell wall biosynthesis
MRERGHEVTVVGLAEEHDEHYDKGVRVIGLQASKTRYLGPLASRMALRRWLSARAESRGIDIVEAPEFGGFLPFKVRGCRTVLRLHDSATCMARQSGQKVGRGTFLYERATLRSNPCWIGVSQFILDLTQRTFGLAPKQSVVIYNPVGPLPDSLPDVPCLPPSYVLYAGSVSQRKGALVLAEAAREFLPSHPDLHLVFAGKLVQENGRSIAAHISEIVGLGLARRLCFLGHLERAAVISCMKRAKALALPSRLEALGLVVLEAMACGVPVVYTTAAAGREVIDENVTGLLADPNSPVDVARKVARLLDDQDLANRLASNGRRAVADRFCLEKCLEATEQVYREWLWGPDRPRVPPDGLTEA